ncbi:hypothetical protein [Gilliamella apicola]|uniref:hypothetical protein n=2 Tax=Gilliamella apicola TaxID=1196095 RepID=UPI00080D92F3|nr:hypothetical protein [Gilliamella apicola]OCG10556.1 hypothetical protein A9G14_10040 [Gilliamella apicola]ORF44854.1 hypothetical protein B5800_10300 [Gilliamella apicola]ORF48074.1 hypothetical protein B5799_10260 [Gilliamella apicola]ORF50700.1 hypothetical protein B5803_09120 [Gilliamella apicola]ORF51361.1 hypothetical protein B5802_11380 [Gilliamella apicola]
MTFGEYQKLLNQIEWNCLINIMKVIINENEAFEKLKKILISWNDADSEKSKNSMDYFIEQLIYSKWDRNRIYNFIFIYVRNNLSNLDYDMIPEKAIDYLSDIETSIIGYCCPSCFLKIPGEPLDENDLIAYIRGNKWKN